LLRLLGNLEHFGLDTAHARLPHPVIARWLGHPVLTEFLHGLIDASHYQHRPCQHLAWNISCNASAA
jgi:hypothetical protein